MLSSWKPRTLVAFVIASALTLGACTSADTSDDAKNGTDQGSTAAEDLVTGPNLSAELLATYRSGMAEGKRKYPNVNKVYRTDVSWKCPLRRSVTVAGERVKKGKAFIGKPQQGVYIFGCKFFDGIPIELSFVEVSTAAQLDERREIARTAFYPQERDTEEIEISGFQVMVVRTEFTTNAKAGVRWTAHVFDRDALAEVSLQISNSETRPQDYNGQDVAQELVDILQTNTPPGDLGYQL